MVRRKKPDVHSKKLELLKRLKGNLSSLLVYSVVISIFILVVLFGGGLVSEIAFIDLETIRIFLLYIFAPFFGALGSFFLVVNGLIALLNYLGNRPKILVDINYEDSWRLVQTRDDAYNPRGTSLRVRLNIYADCDKTVSIRKIFLEEIIGSTKNTLYPERWGALNIAGHHSEDLRLNFYSENTVSELELSYELFMIYAKNKEKRIKLNLEKLDKSTE